MARRNGGSRSGSGRFDISLFTEAIDHELRPKVQALGGDVWLDDVLPNRVVVGFRRARAGDDTVRSWLHAELVRLAAGDEAAVDLREYGISVP